MTRQSAIRNNAIAILNSLVKRGVSFADVKSTDAWGNGQTSTTTLEYLLTQGWDINTRAYYSTEAKPLMWFAIRNLEMIKWCLEHGASVRPRDMEPIQDNVITQCQLRCEQILELVAESGDVATFEFLRSKGAPLGWRCLHHAVESATHGDTSREGSESTNHKERMAMVLHLLDVVKIDVNALDQPPGRMLPMRMGTPICYIPGSAMLVRDTRELTWLLLDRGADPTPGLKYAAMVDYPKFIEDVEAWKAEKRGVNNCCVQ